MTDASITVTLSPESVEAIARRTAELVLVEIAEPTSVSSPWLAGAQAAADYLGWPRERVYKALPRLPHYRDGNRLMFRGDELDQLIQQRLSWT